jgi:hypothetical protein
MSIYIDIALPPCGKGGGLLVRDKGVFMGYEESTEKMRSMIARSSVERIFESLVSDVTDLMTKLTLDMIDAAGFIEGLELLIPRLRRFAPGGLASAIAEQCETVLLNALTEGESLDETGEPIVDDL